MSGIKDIFVFDDLNLYTTPEKFYIVPKEAFESLIIDRASEAVSLQCVQHPFLQQIQATSTRKAFCGLLGTVKLVAGNYLILATERIHVGFIAGHAIWQLAKAELVPYCKSTLHLTSEQQANNNDYINMVEQVLATPHHYFSYTYDLTHTSQRLHGTGPDFLGLSLFERAEQRFVWNGHSLLNIFRTEFHRFCLPLLHGFVSINPLVVNGHSFNLIVISRRNVNRAGTRLFRRGVDKDGNVANFVETEQIVECQGDRASFVQTRGSVPLFWVQTPNLRYKPPPRLLNGIAQEDHHSACGRHFESQTILYGRQVLLDLVDQRGAEGRLELAYKHTVNSLGMSTVRYEPFDFHHECRHMRWDRLSILLDRIALDQDEMGFFLMLRDGSLVSLQDGVFRTNCVDCLDRTNVVQSMLARRSLTCVLRKLGVLRPEQTVEQQERLEALFKQVWADNADLISVQYSGTGALKTDFTRTGKRTRLGLLRDGVNSMLRYYKNNFTDGFRQDSIDLFHGVGDVNSPLPVERDWRYVTFPSVLLVAVAMFIASVTLPAEYSTETLLFLLFWGAMVVATTKTILKHGPEFVDKPRLTPLIS